MADTVPSLGDVLALRPATSASADDFRLAIKRAGELQTAMADRANTLEESRQNMLLTSATVEILALDAQAAEARLAADRAEALLPILRADLEAAEGRERLAELRQEVADANAAVAALVAWRAKDFEQITKFLGTGFALEDRAAAAHRALLAHADVLYRRQEVRDAGEVGVALEPLPASVRAAFPNWKLT